MKTLSIISGVQSEGDHKYPYVGLGLGKYEYRIYNDREGWFVGGEYTALAPKGSSANRIKQSLGQAGKQTFLAYLNDQVEKWQLKEKAGIV